MRNLALKKRRNKRRKIDFNSCPTSIAPERAQDHTGATQHTPLKSTRPNLGVQRSARAGVRCDPKLRRAPADALR
jgi:hypothetical protein